VTRRWLRAIGRGLIGALIVAQLAISAYACPRLTPAVDAGSPGASDIDGGDAKPVALAGIDGSMDPDSPNLCAEHCRYGQQSDQASTLTAPVALLRPIRALEWASGGTSRACLEAATIDAPVAAESPHAVLHCVYRF
jgi:hypothetical protein